MSLTRRGGHQLPSQSLRRNFISTAWGNFVYVACQFGMVVVLARFTTPTDVGLYALALSITGPVFTFTNLKLRQVLSTDAAGQFTFEDYFGQRIITSALATSAILVTVFAAGMEGRIFATILAVTAFKAFESVIDILYGAMQRHEQMQLIARSQVWRGIGGLLIFGAITIWTRRVDIASIGLAVYTAPQIAFNIFRVRRLGVSVRPSFDRSQQTKLTWLALPLGISVTAGAVTANMPRYFLQVYEGAAALGVFAVLAYFLVVSSTIVSALAQAASPRLANLYAAGDSIQFKRTLARLVLLGSALGIAGIIGAALLGAQALLLTFGEDYAAHASVLTVLMVSAAAQYFVAFLGTSVNAMRRFRVQMPISIVVLIVATIIAMLAVPPLGLMGGALAMLGGQLCAMACYLALLVRIVFPELRDMPSNVSPSAASDPNPRVAGRAPKVRWR